MTSPPGRRCSKPTTRPASSLPGAAPLLIIQGGNDEQIPVVSTPAPGHTHSCSIGQATQRWIYPGQSHAGVIPIYMPDMIQWISTRFSGNPGAISSQTPTGELGIQVSSCASLDVGRAPFDPLACLCSPVVESCLLAPTTC